MKTIKKPLSVLLFAVMLLSVLCVAPFNVFAAGNTWDPNNGVYNISTEEDLFAFKDSLENSQYYEGVKVNLLSDIKISDGRTYYSPDFYNNDAEFCGEFNGNGHTISNINIVSADNYITSFFPMLEDATIKDLTLENLTIENGYIRTAAFAPATFGDVKILNCHIKGGCLIRTKQDITNSSSFLGGFVADQYNGNLEIKDCSTGENVRVVGVNSSYKYGYAGGILGYIRKGGNNTLISNCVNKASVESCYIASGIVGTITSQSSNPNTLRIIDCANYGQISDSSNGNNEQMIAGILSECFHDSSAYIDRCVNHGDITVNGQSGNPSGGIIGYAANCVVQNTYNTGTLTAANANALGGIIGQFRTEQIEIPSYIGGTETIYYPEQFNTLMNCYNTGSIVGGNSNYVGGVCGIIQDVSSTSGNSVMENAYNFGAINGGVKAGNACAEIQNTSVNNIFSPDGTSCITRNSGSAVSTSHIGYYTSANTDGIIYPATMTTNQSESISSEPLSGNLLQTLNKWVSDKNAELKTGGKSYRYLTWKMTKPASEDGSKGVTVHPMFGIPVEQTVKFHVNEPNASDRLFRVYNGDASEAEDTTEYTFKDGTVEAFYDIPKFAEDDYVFAGWYTVSDNSDNSSAKAFKFDSDIPANLTDVYAHWIPVGEVSKDENDDKILPESMKVGDEYKYRGFGLFGVQIRPGWHYDSNYDESNQGGLRFIASVGEDLLSDIDAISDKTVDGNKVEYGFITAGESSVNTVANDSSFNIDKSKYKIQYKGTNVNGVNTTVRERSKNNFNYITNLDCTSKTQGRGGKVYGNNSRIEIDHRNYTNYRLATYVVKYEDDPTGANLGRNVVARAYMRYYDANGLLRTFYNDYDGTRVYGGCSISYNRAAEELKATNEKTAAQ